MHTSYEVNHGMLAKTHQVTVTTEVLSNLHLEILSTHLTKTRGKPASGSADHLLPMLKADTKLKVYRLNPSKLTACAVAFLEKSSAADHFHFIGKESIEQQHGISLSLSAHLFLVSAISKSMCVQQHKAIKCEVVYF